MKDKQRQEPSAIKMCPLLRGHFSPGLTRTPSASISQIPSDSDYYWTHPRQIFPQGDCVEDLLKHVGHLFAGMSVDAKKTKALDLHVTPQHTSLLEEVFFNADILGNVVEHLYRPDATRVRFPSLSSPSRSGSMFCFRFSCSILCMQLSAVCKPLRALLKTHTIKHQPRLLVLYSNCLSYIDLLTGMEVESTTLQDVFTMTRGYCKHNCLAIHKNHILICCEKPPGFIGKDYVQPVSCSHSSFGLQSRVVPNSLYNAMSYTVDTLSWSSGVASHLIPVRMQRPTVLMYSTDDLSHVGTAAELQQIEEEEEDEDWVDVEEACMGLAFSKGCMYIAM